MHYTRCRCRHTQAERTKEELELLCWERGQALRYFEHVQELVHNAAEELEDDCLNVLQAQVEAAAVQEGGGAARVGARNAMRQAAQLRARATLLRRLAATYKDLERECRTKFFGLPCVPRQLRLT